MLGSGTKVLRKVPPGIGRDAKRLLVYPRFWRGMIRARRNHSRWGGQYRHSFLFIAGMPKSGTTWVEKMVASFPGYEPLLIPEASFAELRQGQGHVFELPPGCFDRFNGRLVLSKMHCHGSANNAAVLRHAGCPYLVLYRDPRDVAVSHVHYVRNTPWHGDYPAIQDLGDEDALRFFLEKRLPEFAAWMRGWRHHRDPDASLMISYEELVADTRACLEKICRLFGFEGGQIDTDAIVERHSFANLAREDGGQTGFFRKGQPGDWKNHFTKDLADRFQSVDGEILVEFGYEKDSEW